VSSEGETNTPGSVGSAGSAEEGRGAGRILIGFVAAGLIGLLASAGWNLGLGMGIPVTGQWDPTVGPVGPVPDDAESTELITVAQAWERYEAEVLPFLEDGQTFVHFLDARTPDHYDEGHVKGAWNVPAVFEEVEEYRPLYEEFRQLHPPGEYLPIIIYCNGADCTDSHTLRDALFAEGYAEIYIMFEGYPAWEEAGHPVEAAEGDLPQEPLYATSRWRMASLAGMVVMLVVALGAFGVPVVSKLWGCSWVALTFRLILGGAFLYASLHKIIDPGAFAKQIYGYGILPGEWINLSAMVLPWVEAVAGALLVIGAFTRGSSLLLALLLVVFLAAVGFHVARGKAFDCGCFQPAEEGAESDPIELLFRDTALLVMALQIVSVRRHFGVGSLAGLEGH